MVCRQLGYDFGSVASSPCGSYGGSDLCGSAGSRVAMANVVCEGGELDLEECSYSEPDGSCMDHSQDSIVYCGGTDDAAADGALRLLDADGAPSMDGVGRLEILRKGVWSPVCHSGFTTGAASVACQSMGYTGVDSANGAKRCSDYVGQNNCGNVAPQLSEVSCSGQEADLLTCPHEESDEVFCAPQESTILHCSTS